MSRLSLARELRACIKTHPNFPEPGIQFEDVSGLLHSPCLTKSAVNACVAWARHINPAVTKVAGLDSRGFLLGPPIALKLRVPFVMIRKPKKLPGTVHKMEYSKEYGKPDALEVQTDAFVPGDNVLLVDDLLATGGTIAAAVRLVQMAGAQPVAFSTIVHLTYLSGMRVIMEACPGLAVHVLLPVKSDSSIDEAHVAECDAASDTGATTKRVTDKALPVAVLAFDIGSGTTKASLVVVDTKLGNFFGAADPDPACVRDVLMSRQIDILVGVDYQLRGHISAKTQEVLLDTIQRFMSEAKVMARKAGHASFHVTGIATAVFRDAKNVELLGRMEQAMHCTLRCINAREEAHLGWTTGMLLKHLSASADASQDADLKRQCMVSGAVWDMGGGSSQLSWKNAGTHLDTRLLSECVNMGTSHALKALERLRMACPAGAAEPAPEDLGLCPLVLTGEACPPFIKVTYGMACQLVDELQTAFRRGMSDARHLPTDVAPGCWVLGPRHVMCIGGPTSAFAAVQTALDRDATQVAGSNIVNTRSHVFTVQDVQTALAYVTGRSLKDWHFMIVPKLCLVLAAMRAMSIEAALFLPSNGSTLAMAVQHAREFVATEA